MSSNHYLCVAKVLVTDSKGSILLLRRSKTHPYYAYHWDFPGGEVEKNEDSKVAALRELYEEAGITLDVSLLRVAFEKTTANNTTHVLYTAVLDGPTPSVTISWEHDRYTWLSLEEVVKLGLPEHADTYFVDVLEWLTNTKPTS